MSELLFVPALFVIAVNIVVFVGLVVYSLSSAGGRESP
jgi:hypothetical protein